MIEVRPIEKSRIAFVVESTCRILPMIATVSNQIKTRWMIVDEAFNRPLKAVEERLEAADARQKRAKSAVYA